MPNWMAVRCRFLELCVNYWTEAYWMDHPLTLASETFNLKKVTGFRVHLLSLFIVLFEQLRDTPV